jgi:hypothetical protein
MMPHPLDIYKPTSYWENSDCLTVGGKQDGRVAHRLFGNDELASLPII